MSMGRPFDPHDRVMREISRRAKKLLDRSGERISESGRRAAAGSVVVYQDARDITIRFRMLDEPGRPQRLVYSERLSDGEVMARFVDLLEISVKELRQHQILDDLADV